MKISTALDKIDEHQLFVPAFQREYVWKREDAKQLFDSLIKEYPTGTMLTWETNKPPALKGPYKYDEKQGAVRILLDGQQRLTTLYMLICGNIPPYYTEQEIVNDVRGLYVNVETLELEYHSKIKMGTDPRWQNITDVFQRKVRVRDITDSLEEKGEEVSREQSNLLDDNMRAIESILDREFPEQTVPIKATVREAIDIFYKVNASGVSLTDAELALAQISGYWPEARDVIKEKLSKLQGAGFDFSLDFVVYVLLGCLYHIGSDTKRLHAPENNETIREAWKILDDQIFDYMVNIMSSRAYVDHTSEINSVYALVPIIVFCFDKNGDPLSDEEIRKLVKWFYYSQIGTRYTSGFREKMDHDLRIIKESDSPFDELLGVIREQRSLEIRPDDFVGCWVQHPLFGLVRWYLKSKGAFCLTTGLELRQAMGKEYELGNDHIFQFSRLKKFGYGRENRLKYSLAQELTNRAIFVQISDRTKGAITAKDYLESVDKKFPNGLSLQCIPEDRDLWDIEKYEQFLQKRREILARELNEFLNSITDTRPTGMPITLSDLIAGGEGEELEFKSSLRWDFKEERVNKNLEDVIVKTVAAFANGQGGTLLVGVDDDGRIMGLDGDYHAFGGANRDKFELHLRNLLNKNFGVSFVTTNLSIMFPEISGAEICQLDIQKSSDPVVVSLKDKDGHPREKFYVRSGNASQEFPMSEMQSYMSERFSG